MSAEPVASDTPCRGHMASGPCAKTARYLVGSLPACGVHMAQVVKWHLKTEPYFAVRVSLIGLAS